jgi:hypothetical protein
VKKEFPRRAISRLDKIIEGGGNKHFLLLNMLHYAK